MKLNEINQTVALSILLYESRPEPTDFESCGIRKNMYRVRIDTFGKYAPTTEHYYNIGPWYKPLGMPLLFVLTLALGHNSKPSDLTHGLPRAKALVLSP